MELKLIIISENYSQKPQFSIIAFTLGTDEIRALGLLLSENGPKVNDRAITITLEAVRFKNIH